MATPKTIILIGKGVRKEAIANAAITPGMLIYVLSTSKVAVHAVAGGNAQKAFAVEDDLQGKSIGQAYAQNDLVQYNVMQRGDEVYALIENGENIAVGDALISAGNGRLKKYAVADSATDILQNNAIVAYAREACNMSDSSDADPSGRCIVEIA